MTVTIFQLNVYIRKNVILIKITNQNKLRIVNAIDKNDYYHVFY
jgi:hypothetical protein